MRRSIVALMALPVLALAPWQANAAAPKVVTVFTDPAGDAGLNPNSTPTAIAPINSTGVDLVKSTVTRSKNDLKFTVKTGGSLQNFGSLPEAARLVYQLTVGSSEYRFTIKSFDIGKPDPVQQDGTDRIGKTYNGLFRLENCNGQQTVGVLTLTACPVVAYLTGSFNIATSTISWSVPLAKIGASKVGTKILLGAGPLGATGCDICFVAHYAERSLTPHTVIDNAPTSLKYLVPKV